jgi:hypothetical protein
VSEHNSRIYHVNPTNVVIKANWQDLDGFKLTGKRASALAVHALLQACKQQFGGSKEVAAVALNATFEAADIYRVKKGIDGRSGVKSMGRFNDSWKEWRVDLKQEVKTYGSEEDRRRGRELGHRLLNMIGIVASGDLAFAR